jgi:RNA polymerase sporulation-specific sigma factor
MYRYIDEVLTNREKEIIELRYGINKERSYTQKQIALKLGISRSYVSRIEKKSLEKLYRRFVS